MPSRSPNPVSRNENFFLRQKMLLSPKSARLSPRSMFWLCNEMLQSTCSVALVSALSPGGA